MKEKFFALIMGTNFVKDNLQQHFLKVFKVACKNSGKSKKTKKQKVI